MNRPDVIRQPLGVVAATFVIMMACVVIRVTTAPYPAETDLAADMPLGRAIDSLFPTGAAACTVGLVAAILNATLLAGMIVRYSVSAVRTYLPMAVYAMTAYGICFPAGSVSATLVPLLLILGSTQMIAAFKRSYQFEHVFKSAFCIGLLPMLYAPALPLVLIVPVTLVLYRRTLREAVVAAAGLLLPFFICSVVWWGLGDSFGLMGHELLAGTTLGEDTALPALFGEKGVWSKVYIGLFAALTLCSAIIILRTLPSLRTRAKNPYPLSMAAAPVPDIAPPARQHHRLAGSARRPLLRNGLRILHPLPGLAAPRNLYRSDSTHAVYQPLSGRVTQSLPLPPALSSSPVRRPIPTPYRIPKTPYKDEY